MQLQESLLEQIVKMEPLEFVGLAKLLGVRIIEEQAGDDSAANNDKPQFKPRSFADVLDGVMKKFTSLNRTRKREIIKLVKKSNSIKRGGMDASNT